MQNGVPTDKDFAVTEKDSMGNAKSTETVEITNNQLNSNEQLKAHISEAMEDHRNVYMTATVIIIVIMIVVTLTLYACSKYCMIKCQESMNNNNNDINNYNDRAPYPGYTNHIRRFSNRFTERAQIRDGNETVEAGEVGRDSKQMTGSRIRTGKLN